jgi:hypothetical protein
MAQATVEFRPFPLFDRHQSWKRFKPARWLLGQLTNNDFADRWLNREYIQAYDNIQIPELSAVAKRVVDDLSQNGVAFATLDEFFGPDALGKLIDVFDRSHEEFKAKAAMAAPPPAPLFLQPLRTWVRVHLPWLRPRRPSEGLKGKQVYLTTIYKAHTFVPNDFVSDYLGSEQYAALAARYMGMVPRFVGNSFWHTYPGPTEERVHSQLWHRDYNDRRLVKVFLYLNDVEERNGPFEYFSGTHGRGPLGRVFNRTGKDGLRIYPDDKQIQDFLRPIPLLQLHEVEAAKRTGSGTPWAGKPSRILCTGPAGRLIFADTFGLHRGGYVREGHRNLIMTTFSTNSNVHRPHFQMTPEFVAQLSPFMRTVFGVK